MSRMQNRQMVDQRADDKRTGALKSINKRDEDRRKAAGVEETVPQLTKEDVSQQSEGT